MIAVIETGGKQYLVKKGDTIKVEKLPTKESEEFVFDNVLLLADENGGEVKIGTPYVDNAKVTAKVEEQGRADKIRVVKYKRKVRYKRVYGHRQDFTKVKITDIA